MLWADEIHPMTGRRAYGAKSCVNALPRHLQSRYDGMTRQGCARLPTVALMPALTVSSLNSYPSSWDRQLPLA
jgi:hypothetical protein